MSLHIKWLFTALITMVFLGCEVNGQTVQPVSKEALTNSIDNLLASDDLLNASIGIQIQDVETGEILVSRDAYRSVIPASTLKVITTGVILDKLGPDFTFTTTLGYTGTIDADGILQGNIIIQGGGDPSLGSDKLPSALSKSQVLAQWTNAIKTLGIRQIEGDIIGITPNYQDKMVPSSWVFSDMGNYYAAAPTALTFSDNTYFVYFKTTTPNSTAKLVRTENLPEGVILESYVKAGAYGTGDNAYLHGSSFGNKKIITGTVPPNRSAYKVKAAVPNPPQFTASLLKSALIAQQVQVSGTAKESFPMTNSTTITTIQSPTLIEIITRINERSDNLYAEHMLRKLGEQFGKERSIDEGVKVVEEWLTNHQLNLEGTSIYDGSGLSRRNHITADLMTSFLTKMKTSNHNPAFLNSMSIVGQKGTMKNMCRNKGVNGMVYGKSGSIGHVRSYCGYVKTRSGRLVAYTLIANNFGCSSSSMKKRWSNIIAKIAGL